MFYILFNIIQYEEISLENYLKKSSKKYTLFD